MIVGLSPQTRLLTDNVILRKWNPAHLLLLRPLLLASLAAVLQLAHEGKDVVLPELKTLRVHEPEGGKRVEIEENLLHLLALVTSAIAALEPHRGGEIEDVLGSCSAQTLEVFWSRASPSVCLLLLLIFCPLSDPLEVIPFHLPRRVSPHLRHLFLHLRFAASEACFPAMRCRFHL